MSNGASNAFIALRAPPFTSIALLEAGGQFVDVPEHAPPGAQLIIGPRLPTPLPEPDHREVFPPAVIEEALGIRRPPIAAGIINGIEMDLLDVLLAVPYRRSR